MVFLKIIYIYKTKMIKMIFDNVFADIIQLVNNLG